MNVSKADWKLFRERLPEWQERYMERLMKEYVEFLQSDAPASEKFWALEKKIKKDKNTPGVQLRIEKQGTEYNLMKLVLGDVITYDDLDGFSDDMIATVKRLVKAFGDDNLEE